MKWKEPDPFTIEYHKTPNKSLIYASQHHWGLEHRMEAASFQTANKSLIYARQHHRGLEHHMEAASFQTANKSLIYASQHHMGLEHHMEAASFQNYFPTDERNHLAAVGNTFMDQSRDPTNIDPKDIAGEDGVFSVSFNLVTGQMLWTLSSRNTM